jgi:hypothetical protein
MEVLSIRSKPLAPPAPTVPLTPPPALLKPTQTYDALHTTGMMTPFLLESSSSLVKTPRKFLPIWWHKVLKEAKYLHDVFKRPEIENNFHLLISGTVAIYIYLNELLFVDKTVLTPAELETAIGLINNVLPPGDLDFKFEKTPGNPNSPLEAIAKESGPIIIIEGFKIIKSEIDANFAVLTKENDYINFGSDDGSIFGSNDGTISGSNEGSIFGSTDGTISGSNEGSISVSTVSSISEKSVIKKIDIGAINKVVPTILKDIWINECNVLGINDLIYSYTNCKRENDKVQQKLEILNFIYNCIFKMSDEHLFAKYGITKIIHEPNNTRNSYRFGGFREKYLKYKAKYLALKKLNI